MELKIEYVDLDQLRPYKNNAKIHTRAQIEQIKKSIKELGMNDPIAIWKNDEIIEGHGRFQACQELGIEKVPIIRLDHLTNDKRKAYALIHNKLTMDTGLDDEILKIELGDIDFDMGDFGFNDPADEDVDIVEDEPPEPPEVPFTQIGDVYVLGDHTLICGDCTDLSVVDSLMADRTADLVVTDPPYNMNYEGAGNTQKQDRKDKRILNDNMAASDFRSFLEASYKSCEKYMADGASCYVFYKELGEGVFIQAMQAAGLTFKQELIWVKNAIVLGGSKYQSMYEPCLLGCKGKSIKKWHGGRKQHSVIESIDLMGEDELRESIREMQAEADDIDIIRERKQTVNDLHPTMKPIRLLAKFIKNSSDRGDIVLDIFAGSGSTMIACEQLGRKCRMLELDPRYCDVIAERYMAFTGKPVTVFRDGKEIPYDSKKNDD